LIATTVFPEPGPPRTTITTRSFFFIVRATASTRSNTTFCSWMRMNASSPAIMRSIESASCFDGRERPSRAAPGSARARAAMYVGAQLCVASRHTDPRHRFHRIVTLAAGSS
jgi:hypothetical protein